ncbi:MAG: acetylxylan esterase [Planctomycetaceae bacterium]|nr:acetylxylan esterase [Planctomycetaceae bacterium]
MPSSRVSRRRVLQAVGSQSLGMVIAQQLWSAHTWADAEPKISALNRFPRMMQEYYVDRIREISEQRIARLNALSTKADAEAYVQSVRGRIRESFGPEPERTPLNARITSVVERDTYRIENVIFESRPGFLVTANLYIPTSQDGPRPGVVGTCGHSHNGKAAADYQSFAQGLARQGYVVLIYDPIGQGERFQYPDEHGKSHVGPGVAEHLMAGNQQYLVGEFLGAWRAWDGIRALDYLLTRDEVDPQRVGVTGNSGGGTMTTWLCGVEPRWTMGAPSCFVTEFRRNLENELPADTEQCPPKALALGLEHEDFLAAMAPKPVIILAKEKDYFDVRGSEAAFERLKRLYGLLGAEENIALFVGPTYHGYTQENREAMYGWFHRATGTNAAADEPELIIEEDKTLWCTPTGQVSAEGSRTVMDFTREQADRLKQQRGDVATEELPRRLRELLQLKEVSMSPRVRILRARSDRQAPRKYIVPYLVETEPGIQAVVYRLYDERHYSRPTSGSKQALLYVSHRSSDAELREEPMLREAIEAARDLPVYTVDLRGMGESQPDTTNPDSYLSPYGSDFFYAAHGIMLDDPYPAQRTRDLLCVLNWLGSLGHAEVHLMAKGWGTIPATYAAVLHDGVSNVTLKNALTSYHDVAHADEYDWPLSSLTPNVLNQLDLPDCYRVLESKGLVQLDPRGPKV